MTDNEITWAKAHFEYGIKCNIFKEPVLSYAKTVLKAFDEITRQKTEFADERAKGNICSSVIKRQDTEIAKYNAELKEVSKRADMWHREAELNAAEIIRLQADKEALIAGQETLQKALAEKNEEFKNQSQNFAVLVSDHRALQQSFDNLKGLYEAEKAKVEKAKEKCIGFAKELQTAKAELKEITEKFNCQQIVYADLSDIIRDKNEEIERLSDRNHKCIYLSDEETTEYCVDGPCPKFKTEAQIRAEAIKEFAEKIDTHFEGSGIHWLYEASLKQRIDNLVKEMVGDAE